MIDQLPILLLITPLLASLPVSAISILFKTETPQKIITALGLLLPFFYLTIIYQQIANGPITYQVGGWQQPYGITIIIDELSIILLFITTVLLFLSFLYSLSSVKQNTGKFYFFFLILATGLNGMFLSGDLFNIYIFFDLTVISSYILITFGEEKYSLKASINYVILGTIASLFFLLAIGFVYMETGLLNLEYIAMNFSLIDTQTQSIIFILFLAAIGIKSALMPFHTWLVDAHSTAPAPISALLSGIIVKAGAYIFIRISSFDFSLPQITEIIIVLGALTAVFGSLRAVMEWDIKRITAFSTISQMGFIIAGIGSLTSIGLAGGIYHLVNHAIFKALLFLCAGTLVYMTGTKDIRKQHIGLNMPVTLCTYIIGILAVSGITPFNGSISKTLIESAVNSYLVIVIMLIIASIGTVASFVKILYHSFLKNHKHTDYNIKEAPVFMLIPMIVLAGLCLMFGLFPQYVLDQFILPASSLAVHNNPVNLSFFEPILFLKEWGIVASGLFLFYLIDRFSTITDSIRDKTTKIPMNQSIIFMILTLIIVSLFLAIYP